LPPLRESEKRHAPEAIAPRDSAAIKSLRHFDERITAAVHSIAEFILSQRQVAVGPQPDAISLLRERLIHLPALVEFAKETILDQSFDIQAKNSLIMKRNNVLHSLQAID
jgi:hypothetical protein